MALKKSWLLRRPASLELILEEKPYDIFSVEAPPQQPIGWEPDLNDGCG